MIGRKARRVAALVIGSVLGGASTSTLAAQQRVIVGSVLDDLGEIVSGAIVAIDGTYFSTTSGRDGRFRIPAPAGPVTLRVRRLGFVAAAMRVEETEGTTASPLAVRLVRYPAVLRGVVVPGERSVEFGQTLTRATVRHVPPLAEPDVLRAVALLPGVSQPNDLYNRFHLAGAAGDETLVTLDGHPMQSATHLSGVIGAFNVAAIDRAEVLAHHVPSTLDTRLGGRLALHSRAPSSGHEGEAIATLLAASITVSEARLPGRVDLLVSARRTYLDQYYERVDRVESSVPAYGDGLVRIGAPVGGRWRVDAIGFRSGNWSVRLRGESEGARTAEQLLGIAATRGGERVRLSARLSSSTLDLEEPEYGGGIPAEVRAYRWSSATLTLDHAATRNLSATHALFADQRTNLQRWGRRDVDEGPGFPQRFDGGDTLTLFGAATDWTLALSPTTSLTSGARLTLGGEGAFLAPRVVATRRLGSLGQLQAAYDRRYQFDSEFGVLPGSPVFTVRQPRRVDAIAATFETAPRVRRGRTLTYNATVFARMYAGRTVLDASDTITYAKATFDRVPARGGGFAAGLTYAGPSGLMLQGSYTFFKSSQRDSEGWHPSDWETPHAVAALASVPLWRGWSLTSVLQLRSGIPTTPVETQVFRPSPLGPDEVSRFLLPGARNSARLPGFRRMDIALRKQWSPGPVDVALSIQAINVLFRDNVMGYDWNSYLERRHMGQPPLSSKDALPMVPSLGVEVRW